MSQQFCLKWNNHMNNMMDVFKSLLSTESMVDVTLACDGLSLKAHKMVLSACSPFFQSLFLENPCKHPIVILKDMKYTELKAIIEFMYHGEVNVAQDQLSALMKTAETLRVKGLAEVTNEKNSQSNNSSQDEPSHRSVPRTDTPPPSKRRRGRTRKRSLSDSNRSDEDSNEPKIKQPMSPEIEELSGDVTMDASNSQFSNMQSQVPLQSTPSHSSNTFHKSSSVISQDPQIEEPTSADESEFGVEPAKLLEQTLTTEELNARRRSNVEMQRRPRSSTDHGSIVPTTSMSSDTSNQQPDSPPDIKPELLELDPPMSPVAGPSHSNDNAMMMYMDQSSTSHPGPSGYQDNTALVPQDSQNQESTTNIVYVAADTESVPLEPIPPGSSIIHKFTSLNKQKKPRKYRCSVCHRMFEAMCHLTTHMRTHTGEKPFVCYLCGHKSARLYDLKTHIITHYGKKRYPCELCPASFNQRNNYERHQQKHQEPETRAPVKKNPPKVRKKQVCEECDLTFANKKALAQHLATHDGRKPFPCEYCDKSFMRPYDLKVHSRIHTGEKPYECSTCGANFRHKGNYYRHLKTHGHGDVYNIE